MNRIRIACKKLVGLHDFRNFCKKDDSFTKNNNLEDDEGEAADG